MAQWRMVRIAFVYALVATLQLAKAWIESTPKFLLPAAGLKPSMPSSPALRRARASTPRGAGRVQMAQVDFQVEEKDEEQLGTTCAQTDAVVTTPISVRAYFSCDALWAVLLVHAHA